MGRLAGFAAISLLLAVTPGPDMSLVTRNALAAGRRGVLLRASDLALGIALWVAATAAGVAALLRASGSAYAVLKVTGGAYLACLPLRR